MPEVTNPNLLKILNRNTAQPQSGPQVETIYTAPDPDKQVDNARADAQLGNEEVRTGIAVRGEQRGVTSDAISNLTALQSRYEQLQPVKEYRAVLPQFMQALKIPNDATGDNTLLYAYSKVMDPGSVVRESEQGAAANGAGYWESSVAKLKKELGVEGGGQLSPVIRERLKRDIQARVQEMGKGYRLQRQRFGETAGRFGINPDDVIGPDDFDPYRDDWQRLQGKANDPTQQDVYSQGIRRGDEMSPDAPFDRERYLIDQFGITPEKEARISAFWQTNSGNDRLTPEAAAQWYQQNGIAAPPLDTLAATVEQAKRTLPGTAWGGIDTSGAEKAYRERLRGDLQAEGFDPTSGGAFGARAIRGAEMGLSDEIEGMGGAVDALFNNQGVADGYRLSRDRVREAYSQMEDQQGGLGVAAELAGGLVSGLAIPSGAARGVAGMARQGAAQGTVAGYGYGEGTGGSTLGAVGGAALGGLTGGVFGKGGEMLQTRAANRAAQSVMGEATTQPVANDVAQFGATMADDAAPVLTGTEQAEIAALAKKATGWGLGARQAKKALVQKFSANPEALAAAKRLGIDVPADVLADSPQAQALTGLSRSEVGSEAEAAWRSDVARIAQYADQAMSDIGGNPDLAQISDDVLARLNGTAQSLENKASALREEVNQAVAPGMRVAADNLQETLGKLIDDYGGLAEAKAAMTPAEKSLLAMLGEGEEAIQPTYARINRLRQDIGEALNKGRGPWADVNQRDLNTYYKALSADQLAAVEQAGGRELADKQVAANELFTKMFSQREEMQALFGKSLEKSLAPLLRRAVTSGAKGDATALTTALERLPSDAQGGAMVSAIMAQSRTNAAHGGFSFANYAKLYRGLRENSPVFAKIAKAVGLKGTSVLNDLYVISNRMADAETRVLKTGKANQALTNAMRAEGLVGSVMDAVADKATAGAGAAVGGMVGGPVGAVGGASIAASAKNAISSGGTARLDKLHSLLSSPEFKEAVTRIAGGESTATATENLVSSGAFAKLGRSIGLLTPQSRAAWLNRIVANDTVFGVNPAMQAQELMGQRAAASPPNAAPLPSANAGTTEKQGENQ